jgi:predicted XRE-type DNA-binding protein
MSVGRKTRREKPASMVRESSGNVFADLDVPASSEALAKAEIAERIAAAIRERGLTQVRAASALGVDQSDISDLVRGKLKGFSTERLLRFLTALGRDVEIVIRPGSRSRAVGRIRVFDHFAGSAVTGSKHK